MSQEQKTKKKQEYFRGRFVSTDNLKKEYQRCKRLHWPVRVCRGFSNGAIFRPVGIRQFAY
jgi:hypothetical protein